MAADQPAGAPPPRAGVGPGPPGELGELSPYERYVVGHLPAGEAEVVIRNHRDEVSRSRAAVEEGKRREAEARFARLKELRDRQNELRRSVRQSVHAAAAESKGKIMSGEFDVKVKKKNGRPREEVRKSREVNRPAGLVKDFKTVRAGTNRATVVEMAGKNGGATVEELAKAINTDRKNVMVHLFTLFRDCAIGYSVESDVVKLSFPGSKTWRDALDPKKEAKARKAAA